MGGSWEWIGMPGSLTAGKKGLADSQVRSALKATIDSLIAAPFMEPVGRYAYLRLLHRLVDGAIQRTFHFKLKR